MALGVYLNEMSEKNSTDHIYPELTGSTQKPLSGSGSTMSNSESRPGESSDSAIALEGLIDFDPDRFQQKAPDEDTEKVLETLSQSPPLQQEVDSQTTEDFPIIDEIVQKIKVGALDFFDINSPQVRQNERFRHIFHEVMKKDFGADNGAFLASRYEKNKLSPLMKKRVKQIFRYAMELYHQEMLLKEDSILQDLKKLYIDAYRKNGLDEIDRVIDLVNKRLKVCGAKFGIGPGSATVGDQYGNIDYISIVFSTLKTQDIIMVEWCDVKEAGKRTV